MANMRASFAVGAVVFVAIDWAAPAYAHNVERVRRELAAQGYEQLEFQRTKPPFKLDACREGEKFHLHVDYYGKVTEKTPLGPCGEDAAQVPASEPSSVTAPAAVAAPAAEPPPETAPASSGTDTSPAEPPAQEQECSRYFSQIGKTIRVPCE